MKWWLVVAVGWATGVMGTFFILRFVQPPFSEWSHGDQAQLFQAMIALAGFGAGFVALWSALAQLRRLTTRTVLKIIVGASVGERKARDAGLVTLALEVVNMGGGVCRDWQVALRVEEPSRFDLLSHSLPPSHIISLPLPRVRDFTVLGAQEWQQLPNRSLMYNASGKALFPLHPLPLPLISVSVRVDESVGDDAVYWRGFMSYTTTTEQGEYQDAAFVGETIPAMEYPTISVQDEPGGRWRDIPPGRHRGSASKKPTLPPEKGA